MVHVAFVPLVNLLTVYSGPISTSAFCWIFAEGLLEVDPFLVLLCLSDNYLLVF